MAKFFCKELPRTDQGHIKRGICPWCLGRLLPGGLTDDQPDDTCPECEDEFIGPLSSELD